MSKRSRERKQQSREERAARRTETPAEPMDLTIETPWIGTLTRIFAEKAIRLQPADAASMILEWSRHDPDTAMWVGRRLGWMDEAFQYKVYEIIDRIERTARHQLPVCDVPYGEAQQLIGPERVYVQEDPWGQ